MVPETMRETRGKRLGHTTCCYGDYWWEVRPGEVRPGSETSAACLLGLTQ